MSGKSKVMSVYEVVNKSKFYFKNKINSILIIRTFFSEVLKIISEGNEVRFPRKQNGKIYLVIKNVSKSGAMKIKYIGATQTPSVLEGRIKPVLYGFNPASARSVDDNAKFSLRFSYPRNTIKSLQGLFKNKELVRTLPEMD